MTLYEYLIEKGIEKETAENNVLLWEWELPATSHKIDTLCWEWWNKKDEERRIMYEAQRRLECTKNKTSEHKTNRMGIQLFTKKRKLQ